MQYTTVTNPPEAHNRSRAMQEAAMNPSVADKPETPNVRKGFGALALSLVGIGSALAVRAVNNMAVQRSVYGPVAAGVIQGVLGMGGGFALAAMRQDRTGTAVAAANGTVAFGDLWEQAQLSMSQGATPTPTMSATQSGSPSATQSNTPGNTTVNPGARLPNQGQRTQNWQQQRQPASQVRPR